jgi:DNA-directed RNA polymerase subunit RPC12/RpoP
MSDDEISFGMTIPLDSDGFLRRECPTCKREFKWRPTPEADAEPAQDGGYFCPYCGVQAPIDAWLTQGQLALAQNIIATRAIGPMVSKLGRYQGPAELDPLTEADDMTRIDFPCHPAEPLKVQDDRRKALHCLICGRPFA